MRRLIAGTLMLALLVVATGCGTMKVDVPEPRAAQWTYKSNYIPYIWESWQKKSAPLPLVLTLNGHGKYIGKLTDIPLHQGLTVYAQIKTLGLTDYAKAAKVPLMIEDQDLADVARGNVVRIVVVDPKKRFQTARFQQLRLSPTEDAMERAKSIGDPLILVVLGNREPKFNDFGTMGKSATSY